MKKRIFIAILFTAGAIAATYKLWHHAPVLIFISILVLSFLLSYKITDYIADFKTVKNNSRIDIIFLLIFFILLCVPASHISKAKKAKGENRYLAKQTTLIKKNKLNLDYGKEFNAWFDDRFAYRAELISYNTLFKCSTNYRYCSNRNTYLDKKNKIIYHGNIFQPPKVNTDEKQLQEYKFNIQKLSDYCKANNIKLYFLIVPRQIDFFDKDTFDVLKSVPNGYEQILEYLISNTDAKFIYPKQQMLEANKYTPMYFKTDHHWTKKGTYICYRELMKEINKDFPEVPVLKEETLEKYYDKRVLATWNGKKGVGRGATYIGLPHEYVKKFLDTPYLYYKNPKFEDLKSTNKSDLKTFKKGYEEKFFYNNGSNHRVLVMGNSFAQNLVEFLPYSFKHTVRLYSNQRSFKFANSKEIIEDFKPDIIIYNCQLGYISHFLELYTSGNISEE